MKAFDFATNKQPESIEAFTDICNEIRTIAERAQVRVPPGIAWYEGGPRGRIVTIPVEPINKDAFILDEKTGMDVDTMTFIIVMSELLETALVRPSAENIEPVDACYTAKNTTQQ